MFKDVYKDTSVFITGHTGFKGSWLSLWLTEIGAKVSGYSLSPKTTPNHWDLLNLSVNDLRGDIRDLEALSDAILVAQPEIVFHLAAQPLVRQSYADPVDTWSTNVTGTVNLLEACRKCDSVKSIVIITTDKVYDNKEWSWGYRETDRLGGYDPYSASKAASELVVDSYRKSFFKDENGVLIASARAGNVIGGGDWSENRIIPDIVRSIKNKTPLLIRSPNSTRPWQHVLDCLSGYLLVGQQLLERNKQSSTAWNFGPTSSDNRMVIDILGMLEKEWSEVKWVIKKNEDLHEAGVLYLDSSRANKFLQWQPVWSLENTIKQTADWYKQFLSQETVISKQQLDGFIAEAKIQSVIWSD
jgi:CDP-glucose 4,6-dehydratase